MFEATFTAYESMFEPNCQRYTKALNYETRPWIMLNGLFKHESVALALKNISQDKAEKARSPNVTCPICCGEIQSTRLVHTVCGNAFCVGCFMRAANADHISHLPSCPLCRKFLYYSDIYHTDDALFSDMVTLIDSDTICKYDVTVVLALLLASIAKSTHGTIWIAVIDNSLYIEDLVVQSHIDNILPLEMLFPQNIILSGKYKSKPEYVSHVIFVCSDRTILTQEYALDYVKKNSNIRKQDVKYYYVSVKV